MFLFFVLNIFVVLIKDLEEVPENATYEETSTELKWLKEDYRVSNRLKNRNLIAGLLEEEIWEAKNQGQEQLIGEEAVKKKTHTALKEGNWQIFRSTPN